MSYCKREGKDKSVFVTREDASDEAVMKQLVEEDSYGIILPNGDINWDCPCLGGMAHGTCGQEFKDAFSCFHYSEAEVQGSDCIPQFKSMQECFLQNPEEYGKFTEEEEEGEEGAEGAKEGGEEEKERPLAPEEESLGTKELEADSTPTTTTTTTN